MMSERLGELQGSPKDGIEVIIPPCFSSELRIDRNQVRQMFLPSERARLITSVFPPHLLLTDDTVIRLLAGTVGLSPEERALRVGRAGINNPVEAFENPDQIRWSGNLSPTAPSEVRDSWGDSFKFVLEDRNTGRLGLRLP